MSALNLAKYGLFKFAMFCKENDFILVNTVG